MDRNTAAVLRTQVETAVKLRKDSADLHRAFAVFIEMPLMERLGWLVLGPAWLERRWRKRFDAHSARDRG